MTREIELKPEQQSLLPLIYHSNGAEFSKLVKEGKEITLTLKKKEFNILHSKKN